MRKKLEKSNDRFIKIKSSPFCGPVIRKNTSVTLIWLVRSKENGRIVSSKAKRVG